MTRSFIHLYLSYCFMPDYGMFSILLSSTCLDVGNLNATGTVNKIGKSLNLFGSTNVMVIKVKNLMVISYNLSIWI
jgi:hypothetical protein